MAEETLPQPVKTQRELAKPGFAFLPKTWEELYGYAKEIANTDFVPKALQGKPGAVLAAWQTGQEVGLPPMAALQSIAIINGRPSIHSNGYWALITSSPLCEWFKETPPDEALKQGYGECTIKRRGNPHPIVRRFTIEEAKIAGLLGKDNWKNYPGDMLQNRARHRCGDDAIPEAGQGLLPADVARDLPPEPRDVTPSIAIPKPTHEKETAPSGQTDSTGGAVTNRNPQPEVAHPGSQTAKDLHAPSGSGDLETGAESKSDEAKTKTGDDKGESQGEEKSVEELALAEIAGYTEQTFPDPKELNKFMKGQSEGTRLKITAAYNAKKKELWPSN